MKKFPKSTFIVILFLNLFILPVYSQYKVTRSESFDDTQYFPFGWSGDKISHNDASNYTERQTAPNPVHSGTGSLCYRSGFMFTPGEQYLLASPRYDLTNNPGTAVVSFWMYKDANSTIKDSVTLYINNTPFLDAGRVKVMGPFTRDTLAGGVGWKKYSALIPAGFNSSSVHFIFVFTNREPVLINNYNRCIFIDDFSVETYPKSQALISSTLFYQEKAVVAKGATDQLVIGIKVICDGAGDSLKLDTLQLSYIGTSSLFDIAPQSSKIWYTKGRGSYINTGTNQFGLGATPTNNGGCNFTQNNFFLENGENYFWCTLSTVAGATSGNFIDNDFIGISYRKVYYSGPDTSLAPLVTTLPGGREIGTTVCTSTYPTLTTGTSFLNGSYTSNDYINRVYLRGANILQSSYPIIDNNMNGKGPEIAPWNGGPAPFTVQPPSYEQMPAVDGGIHPHVTAVLIPGALYVAPVVVPAGVGNGGLAIQCGTYPTSNYVAAWIDFNGNGSFSDPGELIHQSGPMNALTWSYASIAVPVNAINGNVKMRVREVYAQPAIDPCVNGYSFGETEDYTVTIIQDSCPGGVKLWLGYTDDWNTPANWCNGVPGINDVVLIDEAGYLGGSQSGAPFDPVIHSGTHAVAKTIRISDTDTLTVNASSGASLQISDSLVISYNTPSGGGGKLLIQSNFADSAHLSNGNISNTISPFQGTRRNQRSQFIYTKSELLSRGLIGGDLVDQLLFYFRSATPMPSVGFGNFTIKYATVDSTWTGWPATPLATAPNTSPFITVYNTASFSIPAYSITGSFAMPITLIPGSFIWNGVSDIVVEICYDRGLLPAASSDNFLTQTQTTGKNYYLRLNTTGATPSGCALGFPFTLPAVGIATQFRPNMTFVFHRPYAKFPVNISGNGAVTAGTWINNGSFLPGRSEVTFSNSSQNQEIGGAHSTTYSYLVINKTGALATQKVQLNTNTSIDSALVLTSGYLDLNKKTISINNTSPSAITRTTGWIVSESAPPGYGIISWKIGTNTLLHQYPFGTANGAFIPFEFTNKGLNKVNSKGIVSVATYKTTANNIPYAASGTPFGTSVVHMNSALTGLNSASSDVVDRFWQINKTGTIASDSAKLKFSYVAGLPSIGEEPAVGLSYTAERFRTPNSNGSISGGWKNKGGTNGTGNVTVTLLGDVINGPWALANVTNPLGDSIPPCGTVSPPVSVTPGAPSNVCSGSVINLVANSPGKTIYWYTVPNGGSSIGTSASGAGFPVTPLINTIYYAEAHNSSGCTSSSRTASALITVKALPGVSVILAQPVLCLGESTSLSVTGGVSFTWLPSNGISATTGSAVTAQPVLTTTYTVTGTTSFGCTKSVSKTITVNSLPVVTVSPGSIAICPGDSQNIIVSGNAANYTWMPTSGLNVTSGGNIISTPASTTTYTVTATNANGCTATGTSEIIISCPASKGLYVNNLTATGATLHWTGSGCAVGYKIQYRVSGTTSWSTVNINTNTTGYTLGSLVNSTTYEWKVATKCATGSFAAYSNKKTFTTTVIFRFSNETVHESVDGLSVFPNPAGETITLEFQPESGGDYSIQILNSLGQCIFQKNILVADDMYSDEFNIRSYATGLYLIRIENQTELKMIRFLKE